jgi:peptidoglycan/xylan/chitin deacetylase (PgdA/CDA1 family)
MDERRVEDELVRSRDALTEALGTPPVAIAYPFGAVNVPITRAASHAGYELGFGIGGRWSGDALIIPRQPVHAWSPSLPAVGALGALERVASSIAGRCSVGTALWRGMTRVAAS